MLLLCREVLYHVFFFVPRYLDVHIDLEKEKSMKMGDPEPSLQQSRDRCDTGTKAVYGTLCGYQVCLLGTRWWFALVGFIQQSVEKGVG